MRRRRATSANLLIVGIFTLLAVGSWVIFDVYRALTNTTIPEVLQKQIEPLKANLTTQMLNNLKQRRQFDPVALSRVRPFLGAPVASEAAEEVSILPGTEAPLVPETTPEATAGAEAETEAVVEEGGVATESGTGAR